MTHEEFMQFLRSTLIKIENAINLIEQDVPKHISAYNKMLGIQQKFAGIDDEHKGIMFSQLITVRSVINYFLNGRYEDGYQQILKLKREISNIDIKMRENERDKNK